LKLQKILVWDKASQDSVGLVEFHSTRSNKYQWHERAVSSLYTLKAGNEALLDKIKKEATNKTAEEVLEKFNKEETLLSVKEKVFEKDKSNFPKDLDWSVGSISGVEINKRNKASSFYKIEEILPSVEKTLKEARGYVIADYQDYLDKKWLEELKKDYNVEVDMLVFDSLVVE